MDRFKEVGYPEGCWGVGGGEKRKGRDRDRNWGERGEVWVGRKNGELGERWEKTGGEGQGERGRSEKKRKRKPGGLGRGARRGGKGKGEGWGE